MLTIGHSTRPIECFIALLQSHAIQHLVDVRTIPKSRHNPQFILEELSKSSHRSQIAATHIPGLGGRRRPRKDSSYTGWRNLSFRGYADPMETPEFEAALQVLIGMAAQERIAILCAEAVPGAATSR